MGFLINYTTIFNDKRKGKSSRRLKIMSSNFNPDDTKLSKLKKELLKYNYQILFHKKFEPKASMGDQCYPSYVFHFAKK